MNVAAYWAEIEEWLFANAPDAIPFLPAGASPSAFAAAERQLGYHIPADVKEFLAVHDGSGHLWLHDRGEFMSLKTMLSLWDMEVDLWGNGNNDEWAKPSGPIRKKWFTRDWLPLLDARTGDYVCLDMNPPNDGKLGQLFSWHHDGGPTEVIADSFSTLLGEFVHELKAGSYSPRINDKGQPYLDYRANATDTTV